MGAKLYIAGVTKLHLAFHFLSGVLLTHLKQFSSRMGWGGRGKKIFLTFPPHSRQFLAALGLFKGI